MLRHREQAKLRVTVEGLIKTIAADGRIHTTFNQTVAATGRLSSTDPNLQNIPVRTDEGRAIRRGFVVGEGFETLMTADYSQIELRVMAHLSEDAGLIEAFTSGEDLHTTVASQVFGVEKSAVDAEMRRKIKAMSYGLAYGLSAFGLSQQLNIEAGEARGLMDTYFLRFGGVRDYLHRVVEEARSTGYTETILGRRRYLPDLNSDNRQRREAAERMALNAPIQGTAADIVKVAMLKVDRALTEAELTSRMLFVSTTKSSWRSRRASGSRSRRSCAARCPRRSSSARRWTCRWEWAGTGRPPRTSSRRGRARHRDGLSRRGGPPGGPPRCPRAGRPAAGARTARAAAAASTPRTAPARPPARAGAEAGRRDDVERCVDVSEPGIPAGAPVDDPQEDAQREERPGPPAFAPGQHRHGLQYGDGSDAPQTRVREPGQDRQGHGRTAVLHDLEHRVAADAPVQGGDQVGAPPVVVREGVPHDVGSRADHRGQGEPGALGEGRTAGPAGRAPQEGVHASPRRPGQQRDERFAQHQPQCHQGARDEDVHGEHSPHGMCHLAEFHGSGDGRVRVVRQVGRERSGDERGGDEGSTAPSGPADPREHGCGVAERERHDGKYA